MCLVLDDSDLVVSATLTSRPTTDKTPGLFEQWIWLELTQLSHRRIAPFKILMIADPCADDFRSIDSTLISLKGRKGFGDSGTNCLLVAVRLNRNDLPRHSVAPRERLDWP